jgi:hypothetical protein
MTDFFEEIKDDYVKSKCQLTFREAWDLYGKKNKDSKHNPDFGHLLLLFGDWIESYEKSKNSGEYENWNKEDLEKIEKDLHAVVKARKHKYELENEHIPWQKVRKAQNDPYVYLFKLVNGTELTVNEIISSFREGGQNWFEIRLCDNIKAHDRYMLLRDTISINTAHILYIADSAS